MARTGALSRPRGESPRRMGQGPRLALAALLAAALALPGPVLAQELLAIGPGQSLRLHPATPERPATARYSLELAAGDWLAVTAPAAIVQGAAAEPPIRLRGPDGQETTEFGRLVQRIGAAGPWMLEVQAFHTLSVSRYPAGHPVVEVGLDPAALRLAPGMLGKVAMAAEPMDPRYDDAPPPSGWPARLAIRIGQGMEIHLYRRAALRQMALWPHDPTRNLAALLAGDEPVETGLHLPVFPIGNNFMAFAAQAERVQGACFTWLRYIARFDQEQAYPFETLTYVALGLSRDGQWFAVAMADTVPAALPGQPAQPREGRSPEYEAALAQAIAGNPAALAPPLAALDAVARSLAPPCGER
jgi:hypothetical protein